MRRSEREFLNLLLVEQPNGDFAHTMVRGVFFDVYQVELWADLSFADDTTLAGIAARPSRRPATTYSTSAWVIRLGDGTDESHRRAQTAVDHLWRYTAGFAEKASGYRDNWGKASGRSWTKPTFEFPTIPISEAAAAVAFTPSISGRFSPRRWMQRSHPGLAW